MLSSACASHRAAPAPASAPAPVVAAPASAPKPLVALPPAQALAALTTVQRQGRAQRALDAYRLRAGFPGAVLAVRFADGTVVVAQSGLADRERGTPMPADGRMLAGGAGKTLFAALALALAQDGRLNLDTPIAVYLRGEPWIHRLPNANRVTARMLLAHTSGYHGYTRAFYDELGRDPLKPYDHRELLRSLFDAPVGEPGARVVYSDLNYAVLATLEEAIGHEGAYAQIERRFLRPMALHETAPADGPRLVGLVPGYTGPVSPVGNMMAPDGSLIMNPEFEWGFISSAGDLARWVSAFCRGEVIHTRVWTDAAHAGALGVSPELTTLGRAYGTRGFFPGYMTRVRWYRDLDVSVAMQVNTSDTDQLPGWDDGAALDDVIRMLIHEPPPP